MKKAKTLHFTVRLLKEGVNYKTTLQDISSLTEYKLRHSLPFKGKTYIPPSRAHAASWSELIRTFAADSIGRLNYKSASAFLFIEKQQHHLVFTSGQGRYALRDDSCATDLGLKVTLNSVDADKIRSIDAKTIDERTLTIR